MMTPATERAQLPVADAVDGEGIRQRVPVELWRCPRARNRPHVHEQRDVNLLQERHECGESSRGVADGENGIARLVVHLRSFVSADPLCIAM